LILERSRILEHSRILERLHRDGDADAVHAAAIIGESMDENSARITVMDKDRRMFTFEL
jgi:hypothetical protein